MIKKIIKSLRPNIGLNNYENRVKWLKEELGKIPKGKRILDAGAGSQQYKKYCNHLIYLSQDFGEYDGVGDSTGLQTGDYNYGKLDIISDITSIPEPDNSFDVVMCIEVLEHVPEPVSALEELARLVKPGGKLILSAPFNSLTHFAPFHFVTGFSRFWYLHHLVECKFEVNQISSNGNYFEYLGQELYRLPSLIKKYAKNSFISLITIPFIFFLLIILKIASNRDNGSKELQCYGFHVIAIKNLQSLNV